MGKLIFDASEHRDFGPQGFRVQGLGLFWGLVFKGSGFRAFGGCGQGCGLEFRVSGSRFKDLGFRGWGWQARVQGLGFGKPLNPKPQTLNPKP